MAGIDDNLSDNLGSYKDEKPAIERLDIEKDDKNYISKSSDTESCTRDIFSEHTLQDWLFRRELLASLREIKFSDQEFIAGISISNIKYNDLESQNHNLFHHFFHQLDYD